MSPTLQKTLPTLIALICATSLLACGGGGASADSSPALPAASPVSFPAASPVSFPAASPVSFPATSLAASVTAVAGGKLTPIVVAPTKPTAAITTLSLDSTSKQAQAHVPVTFGHVFAKGDLPAGSSISGSLADGTTLQLQVDAKATHPDGSLRHAVISAILPQLAADQHQTLTLNKFAVPSKATLTGPEALINSGFSAAVSVRIGEQTYTASADQLLKSAKYTTWLSGPIVNEWLLSAPLKTAQGVAHPHLSARFAIRSYTAMAKARVDITVENDWAFEPSPQNFTYDTQITVGGNVAYEKTGLTHFHHARWRKVVWWGATPEVHIKHNLAYLIASRALPNYDQAVTIPESSLVQLNSKFSGPASEPMGTGLAAAYMPTTGGRLEIGLLPGWAATYLLSMDKRAKNITLGMGDLAGTWSAHYRDKLTDRPVSIIDHPYMTILGRPGDTVNPATKKSEAFPPCATTTACTTPTTHDSAHQPGFSYLPYLVTGDYYQLEELQFWTMWNLFSSNPNYRDHSKGLIWSNQARAQAWNFRTLSEAAYITPDADPLKAQFETFMSNNLDWYNANYTNSTSANPFGAILALIDGVTIRPWQDDFFTSAIGHAAELGYTKALPLLVWKAKFPISRMTGPGVCWIGSGIYYTINLKASATSPLYPDMGAAYQASNTPEFNKLACGGAEMAASLKLKVGEMAGYADGTTGFPANLQPALAYSADARPKDGVEAWKLFAARAVKPNYGLGPQFAIVPR